MSDDIVIICNKHIARQFSLRVHVDVLVYV